MSLGFLPIPERSSFFLCAAYSLPPSHATLDSFSKISRAACGALRILRCFGRSILVVSCPVCSLAFLWRFSLEWRIGLSMHRGSQPERDTGVGTAFPSRLPTCLTARLDDRHTYARATRACVRACVGVFTRPSMRAPRWVHCCLPGCPHSLLTPLCVEGFHPPCSSILTVARMPRILPQRAQRLIRR